MTGLTSAAPFVAGIDGCPAGWIAVVHPLNQPECATWHICQAFTDLLAATASFAAVAVDMPIGLPDIATPGGREADREARAVLGARQSSVFAVPSRDAIRCTEYARACEANLARSNPPRKVAKQTFNLFPKIREIDASIAPGMQHRLVECHPEVAFWAMNGRNALEQPKKRKSSPYPPGLELRRQLLSQAGYRPRFLHSLHCPRYVAADDDLLDACATAWTAARLALGKAGRFPATVPLDGRGLRMEIVF